MSEVCAPWTDEQVANLNEYQQRGMFHPFTCQCPHPGRVLVAERDGWKCPNGKCGHKQTWAHIAMANGTINQITYPWEKQR